MEVSGEQRDRVGTELDRHSRTHAVNSSTSQPPSKGRLIAAVAAAVLLAGSAVLLVLRSSSEHQPPTTTSGCEQQARPTKIGQLELAIGRCGAGRTITLIASNTGTTTCNSDIMARMYGGQRMWFVSDTGAGGERGHWEPAPDGAEGVGSILYPPGQRRWAIRLALDSSGPETFTIPITCGNDSSTFAVVIDGRSPAG